MSRINLPDAPMRREDVDPTQVFIPLEGLMPIALDIGDETPDSTFFEETLSEPAQTLADRRRQLGVVAAENAARIEDLGDSYADDLLQAAQQAEGRSSDVVLDVRATRRAIESRSTRFVENSKIYASVRGRRHSLWSLYPHTEGSLAVQGMTEKNMRDYDAGYAGSPTKSAVKVDGTKMGNAINTAITENSLAATQVYLAQDRIADFLANLVVENPETLFSLTEWLSHIRATDNGEFRPVMQALWADMHDPEVPFYMSESVDTIRTSLAPERFIGRFLDADIESVDDPVNILTVQTVASLGKLAQTSNGRFSSMSTAEQEEYLYAFWPQLIRGKLETFADSSVLEAKERISDVTKPYGSKFYRSPSAQDEVQAVEDHSAFLTVDGSSRDRNKSTRRARSSVTKRTRNKRAPVADFVEEPETAQELAPVGTMVFGEKNRIVIDPAPDSVDTMLEKFCSKNLITDIASMTDGINSMIKQIRTDPKGIGTEVIVDTDKKHGLRQFSPRRTPGLSAAGELDRVRIIYSVVRGKDNSRTVAIEGIYDHKGFDKRVITLRD